MISPDPDERWRAYVATYVRIEHPTLGLLEVRPAAPGVATGRFPDVHGRTVHIMTAQNPGRTLSDQDNAKRQLELLAAVEDMPVADAWPALGGDPTWVHTEESVAVVGLSDEEAIAVARRFDQDAIFAWTPDAWELLSCRSDRREVCGYELLAAPGS